jgi:sulfatase modifying factor 1
LRNPSYSLIHGLAVSTALVGAVVALVGMVGGCTKGMASTEGASDPSVSAGERVTSEVTGSADKAARHSDLGAKILARIGTRRETGDTPLDQLLGEGDRPLAGNGLCPPDMASIDDRFCVDRYEASLVEVLPNGEERTFSPYSTLGGRPVRAVSQPHVFPQAHISGNEAAIACARSGKRLCKPAEWRTACMGSKKATFGYGNEKVARRCNDHGKSAMGHIYGYGRADDRAYWSMDRMNNPALNQVPGTLARTGDHAACTNDYGVYDMVGNLHEWVADPRGTFQGGYYLDTQQNGDGCTYKTMAHESWYHDYSTGFRCCADVAQ